MLLQALYIRKKPQTDGDIFTIYPFFMGHAKVNPLLISLLCLMPYVLLLFNNNNNNN